MLSCDKIVTVGNEIKELLLSKSRDLTNEKFEVITNGFDASDFEGFDQTKSERFTITYTGTVSSYYRLEGLVSALVTLLPEIRNKIFVRFVGNISQNIKELFEKANLASQLDYVGYVSHKQSIVYLYEAHVLLLLIPEVQENKGILTGKFFEYLATGRPILAIGPTDGDVARILQDTGAGFMINYDNVSDLKEKIMEFYADYKDGKTSIPANKIEKYSRKHLTGNLVKLFEN